MFWYVELNDFLVSDRQTDGRTNRHWWLVVELLLQLKNRIIIDLFHSLLYMISIMNVIIDIPRPTALIIKAKYMCNVYYLSIQKYNYLILHALF